MGVIVIYCEFCVDAVSAGLRKGVTDSGIGALASAGCGAQLTSLTLKGV